jgi:hypothetical protein
MKTGPASQTRMMPMRLRIFMKKDGGLHEEIERDNGPYQTCLADASA